MEEQVRNPPLGHEIFIFLPLDNVIANLNPLGQVLFTAKPLGQTPPLDREFI